MKTSMKFLAQWFTQVAIFLKCFVSEIAYPLGKKLYWILSQFYLCLLSPNPKIKCNSLYIYNQGVYSP